MQFPIRGSTSYIFSKVFSLKIYWRLGVGGEIIHNRYYFDGVVCWLADLRVNLLLADVWIILIHIRTMKVA